MHDAIDFIGGALGAGAGTDLTFVNVVVMKDSFDTRPRAAVATWRGNPAFAPDEIERQRQQMLSGLKVSYDDPDYIANSCSIGSSTASIRTACPTAARRRRCRV